MKIKKGDKLPDAKVFILDKYPKEISIKELIGEDRVILFGLPGAFTPTCHRNHLPGYLDNYSAIKSKGIDEILCFSTNDIFVNTAWIKSLGAEDKVLVLSDSKAEFAKA